MAGYRRSLLFCSVRLLSGKTLWLRNEFIPSIIAPAILGVMIIMTLITIGETPSGHAADLAACHTIATPPYVSIPTKAVQAMSPESEQAGRLMASSVFVVEAER